MNPTSRTRALLAGIFLAWGYLSSGVIFAFAIAIPAIAYWRTDINRILIFWTAYVLTRPLGASFADWLGKDKKIGGLGLGDGTAPC